MARDRTCRWPGCDRPATVAEIDRTTPYPDGATAADDLGPFCKSHHIGKHHSRWRVRQPEPGRFEWISPTGHTYTVEPEPLGPVHDPPEPDRAPDGDTVLDRDTGLDPPPF
ncbi:MAG TPA: HNH endonuclease signature motif containing protein [Jiangellaceae bacterium]|nr:HNH endonuclease signature motif containing protein [Jiangellaceae bacterium]